MEDALAGPNVDNWREYARNLPAPLRQHPSGLYLLPTGQDASLTGEAVEDLAELLCANFELVIFDFGTKPFYPYTRTGLELASKVFVLALQEQGMMEVLVSRFLAEHEDWIRSGKAALVVNRVSPLGYYKPSQVARMAGFPSYKEVPDDPQSFEAAKKAGKAVVQLQGSPAGEAFALIAEEAFGPVHAPGMHYRREEKRGRGLFGRIFGRR
jgi:Flp pilus assembly CpaE family ATPase